MTFEDILEEVGSFGRFQKLLCFLLIPLTTGLCGLTYYTQIFILSVPEYRCVQEFNGTLSQSVIQSLNRTTNSTQNYLLTDEYLFRDELSCHQLSTEEEVVSVLGQGLETTEEEGRGTDSGTGASTEVLTQFGEKCSNGWVYKYDTLFPTVASQNNWVCDEAWKPYLIVSCFWVGNTVGAWIYGVLSDKYGRRPMIAAALMVYGAAGLASAFASTYFYLFLALRTLVGFSHHTVSHLPFVLVVEYCGIKSRVIPLLTIMAAYTLASFMAPLLAIAVWDWKILTIATSLPSLLAVLLYKCLPESTSWMMTKGDTEAAITQLQQISNINKVPKSREHLLQHLTDDTPHRHLEEKLVEKGRQEDKREEREEEEEEEGKDRKSPSLTRLLKFPKLRRNVAVVLFIWMISCMCFYGHCQNTANIGSDIFMSYLIGAAIEIPSWSVPYLIQKFGRKSTLSVAFLLSGFSGVVYASLPLTYTDLTNVVFAFALLGRMFITGAYYITLQYGPEIFPTVVRGRGVAMSETLGGVAIFVSPLVVYLGEFERSLPILIFSILSIIGGLATFVLPETKGKALPQTLSQAEMFARNSSQPCSCLKSAGNNDGVELRHLDRKIY